MRDEINVIEAEPTAEAPYVCGMARVGYLAQKANARRSPAVLEVPVVLIGCSKKKLDREAPARDLYQGQIFKWSKRYAEARKLPWAVLSARWGLVLPDRVLAPYDCSATTIRAQGAESLKEWSEIVRLQLDLYFPKARFVFMAGSSYRSAVAHLPKRRVSEPMKGLQIGERLRWLRREAFEPVGVAT